VLLHISQNHHEQSIKFDSPADATAFLDSEPQFAADGGSPLKPGIVLFSVLSSKPFGKINGTCTLDADPAVETKLGTEPILPLLKGLIEQVMTILYAFSVSFPGGSDTGKRQAP
jgi:hypothetical protein